LLLLLGPALTGVLVVRVFAAACSHKPESHEQELRDLIYSTSPIFSSALRGGCQAGMCYDVNMGCQALQAVGCACMQGVFCLPAAVAVAAGSKPWPGGSVVVCCCFWWIWIAALMLLMYLLGLLARHGRLQGPAEVTVCWLPWEMKFNMKFTVCPLL